ncbi:EVE domain-containing protein [Thalassotalea ganghwensis]
MAYWLLKTEPDEFSIDDLQNIQTEYEPWDGIRNYQARNIIRDQIKAGDQVFIYHSSCKLVGVAGIGKVVKSAYPDPSQFNPESKYFDSKSSMDNPRWFCLGVSFVEKFKKVVSLADIKNHPALSDMVLVKQGRLSVQPVTADEWQVICQISER